MNNLMCSTIAGRFSWLGICIVVCLFHVSFTNMSAGEDSRSMQQRVRALAAAGKYDEALPIARRAVDYGQRYRESDKSGRATHYNDLAIVCIRLGRYEEAKAAATQSVALVRSSDGIDSAEIAFALTRLGLIQRNLNEYDDAVRSYEEALKIYTKRRGREHADVVDVLFDIGVTCRHLNHLRDAVSPLQEALEIQEKLFGPDDVGLAVISLELGLVYLALHEDANAEASLTLAATNYEKKYGPDSHRLAEVLVDLANAKMRLSRLDEAGVLIRRALAIHKKNHGPDDINVGHCLHILAVLHRTAGEFVDAEREFRKALEIYGKSNGEMREKTANVLGTFADLLDGQERSAEALTLRERSLKLYEESVGLDHVCTGNSASQLGKHYGRLGRYAEGVPLLRQAIRIHERVYGVDNVAVADDLIQLGNAYMGGFRTAEAEAAFQRALAIRVKAYGSDSHRIASAISSIAGIHFMNGELGEAERMFKRSIALVENEFGSDATDLDTKVMNLGLVSFGQANYAEAAALFKRALAINEKHSGKGSKLAGMILTNLTKVSLKQEEYEEAESWIEEAVSIYEAADVAPAELLDCYLTRARIAWAGGRRGDALADLRLSMRLADDQLKKTDGAARERAMMSGGFSDLYSQMVEWQWELGDQRDLTEVIGAIEAGRARTLLDDMNQAGSDLNAGRSVIERESLKRREIELKQQIAQFARRLELSHAAGKVDSNEHSNLQSQLEATRQKLYDFYRDQRNSSVVYRKLLTANAEPPRLRQLQRLLAVDNALMMIYVVADDGVYALWLDSSSSDLVKLTVSESAAEALGIESGPLTSDLLTKAMSNDDESGVLQQLSRPESADKCGKQLAALWTTLIPEPLRERLIAGEPNDDTDGDTDDKSPSAIRRLIVVPDGRLALLPFETLVVGGTIDDPTYLLDAGPPVSYCPSATVFYKLTQRKVVAADGASAQVLTVGDPNYGDPTLVASQSAEPAATGLSTTRSLYRTAGGQLARLPNSGVEARWVASVFKDADIDSISLIGTAATEAGVRKHLKGRRYVHLACHGLVDHDFGNLFGALSLSPGANSTRDPADDGFLTLGEMHDLNLDSCELAILSACQTNFGPQQKGEGVWAISRGFMIAGARRVVASNWLVDDRAAASLVSYFCGGIANAEKQSEVPDYAGSLHAAKKWTRNQEKWKSPYYWGSFVLSGSN